MKMGNNKVGTEITITFLPIGHKTVLLPLLDYKLKASVEKHKTGVRFRLIKSETRKRTVKTTL